MIKNKQGDHIGFIDNCNDEVISMFGRKVIDSIQLEEKTARECPEKEPFYPYESNIRIFMIDNNKCPMYCCAIVYDMPHRIKTEKKSLFIRNSLPKERPRSHSIGNTADGITKQQLSADTPIKPTEIGRMSQHTTKT